MTYLLTNLSQQDLHRLSYVFIPKSANRFIQFTSQILMHLLKPAQRDEQSPAISHRTNPSIKPQPPLINYRYDPNWISLPKPIPEKQQPEEQRQLNPAQESAQQKASKSSLRYSESPQGFTLQNAQLTQRKAEMYERYPQGYPYPPSGYYTTLLQKIHPRQEVKRRYEDYIEGREWTPRPPFCGFRLRNPMYREAEERIERNRRNAVWALRTYGRQDYVENFYVPSDELVVSDADELTTECESRSLMRADADGLSGLENDESNHFIHQLSHLRQTQQAAAAARRLQETINELSRITQLNKKLEGSEKNSKVSSSTPVFKKSEHQNSNNSSKEKSINSKISPSNQNSNAASKRNTLRNLFCELKTIPSHQRQKLDQYEQLGPDLSQNDFTQIQKKSVHSNIEKMTYEELSQSIVRCLRSMDDALKSQVYVDFLATTSKSERAEIRSVSKKEKQEMKRSQLFERNYQMGRSKKSREDKSESLQQELKFSSRSGSQKLREGNSQSNNRQVFENVNEIERFQKSRESNSENNGQVLKFSSRSRSKRSRGSNSESNQQELKFSSRSRSKKSFKEDENEKAFSFKPSSIESRLKESQNIEEPFEQLENNPCRKNSCNSNIYQEKKTSSKHSILETSKKYYAQDFIDYGNHQVENERQKSVFLIQDDQVLISVPSPIMKLEDEPQLDENQQSNHSSEEKYHSSEGKSSEPLSSERQKYSRFMGQNSSEVSAIYPIRKKSARHRFELQNESQYLKSNDEDMPLTFSEKKSMMRVFNEHFDNSTKNIMQHVNNFPIFGEVKELESQGCFESKKETIKMEKVLNFAKTNMSDVSKSLKNNISQQNYKTVPARSGKDEPKDLQELPEFMNAPKLTGMLMDKRLKESVIGSEDMGSKNWQMQNPSDSEDSQKDSVKKEEEDENMGQYEF